MFFLLVTGALLLWLMALLHERRKVALLLTQSRTEVAEQRGQLAQLSRLVLLGELSGAIAHEIHQPLTAILINAETAVRLLTGNSIDVHSLRETLEDILASNRHAVDVVRRLRGLFHNGETLGLPIDLNEIMLSALALARSDLTLRKVRVETRIEPRLRRVRGDRVQIQQVILNLIVNACEAMSDAPIEQRRLQLVTRNGPQPSEVELTVSDWGVGVEPLQLERIFQPFVTTKRHGMGLGLSISRSIVTAHGGRIWAESAARGAIFHLTLSSKD